MKTATVVKYSPVTRIYSIDGPTDGGAWSTSVYSREEAFEALAEGGIWIDTEDMKTAAFARAVIDGPMVDCRANAPELNAVDVPDWMVPALGGEFQTLALLQKAHRASPKRRKRPGPLDLVSPAVYAEYWRAAGARILIKRGGLLLPLERVEA